MHHMIATVILLITVNGLSGSASPWQRLARRTNVRAALANKMDPNFWPSRGRRSDVSHPAYMQRQASDEEGPFWANRGRSIGEFLNDDSDWDMRSVDDASPPFWANRGRSTDELGGPFWANRGRSTDEQGGPFWANRGRAVMTSGEQGPFWANRGRAIDGKMLHRLQSNVLYADEPGWKDLPVHERRSSSVEEPFWPARGKKQDRAKREIQCRHSEDSKDTGYKSCRQRSAV